MLAIQVELLIVMLLCHQAELKPPTVSPSSTYPCTLHYWPLDGARRCQSCGNPKHSLKILTACVKPCPFWVHSSATGFWFQISSEQVISLLIPHWLTVKSVSVGLAKHVSVQTGKHGVTTTCSTYSVVKLPSSPRSFRWQYTQSILSELMSTLVEVYDGVTQRQMYSACFMSHYLYAQNAGRSFPFQYPTVWCGGSCHYNSVICECETGQL